jgi:hypothetical protein
VSASECSTLAKFLRPSAGGSYLLPAACTSMLNRTSEEEKTAFEADNANVSIHTSAAACIVHLLLHCSSVLCVLSAVAKHCSKYRANVQLHSVCATSYALVAMRAGVQAPKAQDD